MWKIWIGIKYTYRSHVGWYTNLSPKQIKCNAINEVYLFKWLTHMRMNVGRLLDSVPGQVRSMTMDVCISLPPPPSSLRGCVVRKYLLSLWDKFNIFKCIKSFKTAQLNEHDSIHVPDTTASIINWNVCYWKCTQNAWSSMGIIKKSVWKYVFIVYRFISRLTTHSGISI